MYRALSALLLGTGLLALSAAQPVAAAVPDAPAAVQPAAVQPAGSQSAGTSQPVGTQPGSPGGPQAAAGQTNEVVVFQNELMPLAVYPDPHSCQNFPPLSHVAVNLTNRPMRFYTLPNCLGPALLTIQPGHGTHVHGAGSFSL